MTDTPVVPLFVMVICGFAGMAIWKSKGGDPKGGFIVGALLTLLGLIILALSSPGRRELDRVAKSRHECA